MEQRESMRNYLIQNRDTEELQGIFSVLSQQLYLLHENNYRPSNISSDTIVKDEFFEFAQIEPIARKSDKKEDIFKLSKIMLGAYISLESGFSDYSNVDNDFLKNNYDYIASCITSPTFNEDYFREVLVEEKTVYFHKHKHTSKKDLGDGNSQSRTSQKQKVLSTQVGRMLEQEAQSGYEGKAAFINVWFYPIIILTIALIFLVIYNCI